MKWWQDAVDEMWIGLCVTVIACVAITTKSATATALTVAGSAVSGLVVYLGVKPRKKNGGQNEKTDDD